MKMFKSIFSPSGKQIPARAGVLVRAGAMVLSFDNTWSTLEKDHVIFVEKTVYDGLSQSHDGGDFYLTPLKSQ